MAYRGEYDAYERDFGIVPDIVKQFVVYLYRHIRSELLPDRLLRRIVQLKKIQSWVVCSRDTAHMHCCAGWAVVLAAAAILCAARVNANIATLKPVQFQHQLIGLSYAV